MLTSDVSHEASARVVLRDFVDNDVPWLYALATSEHYRSLWRLGGQLPSPAEFATTILRGTSCMWTIVESQSNRPIGIFQLINEEPIKGRAEMAVLLDSSWRGVASAGVRLAIDRTFRVLRITHLTFRMPGPTFDIAVGTNGRELVDAVNLPEGCWYRGRRVDLVVGAIRAQRWLTQSERSSLTFEVSDAMDCPPAVLDLLGEASEVELHELNLDSLALLEVIDFIEGARQIELPGELIASWRTVGDLQSLLD